MASLERSVNTLFVASPSALRFSTHITPKQNNVSYKSPPHPLPPVRRRTPEKLLLIVGSVSEGSNLVVVSASLAKEQDQTPSYTAPLSVI